MMTSLSGLRVFAAIFLVLSLTATHWRAYTHGEKSVQGAWDAEKLAVAAQSAQALAAALKTGDDLKTKSDQLQKAKNATIAKLNTDLSAALDRLHDRPARPGAGGVPSDTPAGPATGCTGAQLYRDDAALLVRESARADRLLADLGQCQNQYNAARDALR